MDVFIYDLLRTTRRGRVALVRTVYALALLAALYSLYARWFPLTLSTRHRTATVSIAEQARFAEEFFGRFLLVQMGAVLVLTPAYTACAIAEERQRRTLEVLLTTRLSPIEIVLGKLASRLAHLFGVLLTGLPILALLPLWGGVDPRMVAIGFAASVLAMLTLSTLGVWCSAQTRSVGGAVAATYGIAAFFCTCPTCLCFADPLFAPLPPFEDRSFLVHDRALLFLLVGATVQVPVSGLLLWSAAHWLSRFGRSPVPQPLPAPPTAMTAAPVAPPPTFGREFGALLALPSVGEWPLLWKELHFGGSESARALVQILFFVMTGFGVTVTFVLALLVALGGGPDERLALNGAIRVLTVCALLPATIGTALQAAASVVREREQRTLDTLLTVPGGSDEVLEQKWLGSVLYGRHLLLALLAVVSAGVFSGSVHPLAVPALAVAAITHLGFAASLGVFLSVTVSGSGKAAFIAVAVLLLTYVLPAATCCPEGVAVVPPLTWLLTVRPWHDNDDWFDEPGAAAVGVAALVVYAVFATAFWLIARNRFRREADHARA